METGRRFFMFVSSSMKMKIPGDFGRLQMKAGDAVILRDRYENLWSVGLKKGRIRNHELYFQKGWTEFYKENSLEPLDLMVFEYKGGKLFDFKVLGLDACDKKGLGRNLKLKIKEEDDKDEKYCNLQEDIAEKIDDDDVQEKEGVEKEDRANASKNVKRKSSQNLSGVGLPKVPKNRNCTGKKVAGAQTNKVTEEEEEQENTTKKIMPTSHESTSSSHTHKITHCSRSGADIYGSDIFKSGLLPRPKNPYFVTRSRTSRRKNDLYIPKDVIVDYDLKIPSRLFLVDEQDRKWETRIKEWKDGRLWCSRGWGSLCNVNNIAKDDPCICEFVQFGQNSNDFYIKVAPINQVML